MIRARPHIMLQGGVAPDAVALWKRAFPDLEAVPPQPPAMLWRITVGGQDFTLFDSPEPHEFAPTPSWSFMIDVMHANEVDQILDVLADGGTVVMPAGAYEFANRFAWVEDAFAISWQLRFGPKP